MNVGFTGSREGMTRQQRLSFLAWVQTCPGTNGVGSVDEFHHGACNGADFTAVDIVDFMPRAIRIIAHPPTDEREMSQLARDRSTEVRPAKPYLQRNRDIVDASDILLACPRGPEELRSGTWATVRYARKQGKRIVIFWPDGSVTEERA